MSKSTPSTKKYSYGCERLRSPDETIAALRSVLRRVGITRVADITGLDIIGLPVVAVYRPNSRSLVASQGKGVTPAAAEASGLMEAIETYCAESAADNLRLATARDFSQMGVLVDLMGLPRLTTGAFSLDTRMLWRMGTDLFSSTSRYVPYEMVHLDYRLPLPTGSGAFLMSSNGLASGNSIEEAKSHAICELVERDATALWHLSGDAGQAQVRVDLATVDNEVCRNVLRLFEQAGVEVVVWETTTDVGIASFYCTAVDRIEGRVFPMPPCSGAGCHPRRSTALLRALTEAAQTRLTLIAGVRDDLSAITYEPGIVRAKVERAQATLQGTATRDYHESPDKAHDTFEEDVAWELERLDAAGLHEAIFVDLTLAELNVPVVRMIVPHLEAMGAAYVPGRRGRRVLEELRQ